MKTETKQQLRTEIEKLKGQVKDLKTKSRDKFTVTMNRDQLTLVMDRLWRDVSDLETAVHAAEESEDPRLDGYPNLVLLQGECQVSSLYLHFLRQTETTWEFDVATQRSLCRMRVTSDGN